MMREAGEPVVRVCAPLLRTHLLGLLAALDAAITTCLVLLCIRGNVWQALFPPGWPSRDAYATSLGDVVALLGLRWCLVTATGFGSGFLLTRHGLLLTAGAHCLSTVFLVAKGVAALEMGRNCDGDDCSPPHLGGLNLPATLDAFSVTAAWAQYALTLRSLRLLRTQLEVDLARSLSPGLACSWLAASEARQPLLPGEGARLAEAPPPEAMGLRDVGGYMPPPGRADSDDGDSEASFHTTRSDHSAASSFASAATAATFTSATSSYHSVASSADGSGGQPRRSFWGRWRS
mmetsp:Transcript_27780/g.71494  ORF Transcript_27780/g.71494 Transcript_27780/m.71494 type:complete len:290 (+) Transcript_27780:104-973(+)|eukprot:jgi/Tetstr1/463659/TSEL_008520.t1